MAHTHGPWSADGSEIYAVDYNVCVGNAYCPRMDDEGNRMPNAQVLANARLMAAAPELLAVCSALANDLSLFQFTDGEYRLSEQSAGVILQSLREVIAKARGRNE
jgi:hypothetical protein